MANWQFLLSLLRPHLKWAVIGLALALCALIANVTLLAISGWFLAAMASAGLQGITMNYFTPAGIIRFLAVVRTASGYGQRLVNHNTTFLVLKTLRVSVFAALTKVPLQQFTSIGQQLSQLQDDVERLDEFYIGVLLPILLALVALPLFAWVLSLYSTMLMVVSVSALLLCGVLLPWWLSRNLKSIGTHTQAAHTQLNERLVEATRGLKELQLAGACERYWEHIDHAQHALAKEQQRSQNWYARHQGLSLFVSQLTIIFVLIVMIPMVTSGAMVNVNLAMLMLLVLGGFEIVLTLPDAMLKLELTLASSERLRQLVAQPKHSQAKEIGELTSQEVYSLDALNYTYPDSSNGITDISFTIKQGEKVAIVGASGAGKSTLLALLSAQLQPSSGSLECFSRPLSSLNTHWLYQHLGMLSQQCHVFSSSIKNNLLLAKDDANEQQLWQALAQAQLKDFVATTEHQLDTLVGTGGRTLSGGEARRLHITQQLLRDPRVLLLDEPTRGLDNRNQELVIDALMALFNTRTVITVTHESTLLNRMDQVVWLEQGRVRATGTHQQLQKHRDYVRLTSVIN